MFIYLSFIEGNIFVACYLFCSTVIVIGGLGLWNFIDFIVTHRTPLYVLLYPMIKCKVSMFSTFILTISYLKWSYN